LLIWIAIHFFIGYNWTAFQRGVCARRIEKAKPSKHTVKMPSEGDFFVDATFLFEVGGKSKDFRQLWPSSNGYLACDDIERGIGAKIPLWLFGFLY
jgi:hypothetical protein